MKSPRNKTKGICCNTSAFLLSAEVNPGSIRFFAIFTRRHQGENKHTSCSSRAGRHDTNLMLLYFQQLSQYFSFHAYLCVLTTFSTDQEENCCSKVASRLLCHIYTKMIVGIHLQGSIFSQNICDLVLHGNYPAF